MIYNCLKQVFFYRFQTIIRIKKGYNCLKYGFLTQNRQLWLFF